MEDVYEAIVRLRREGHRLALATIVNVSGSIPSYQSAKLLVADDGTMVGTVGGGRVEGEVIQAAREVLGDERPRTLRYDLNDNPKLDMGLVCGGSLEIFVEPILPPAVLYMFGGGHVGLSIYRAARLAGFEVVVVDDREEFASRERFPEALELHAGDLGALLPRLSPSPASFVVIATRAHPLDRQVLRWAVGTRAGYVGMMGSRRKVVQVFRMLAEDGVDPAALERVRAPVGLDIGAASPEEIAVSVVAELIACRRQAAIAVQGGLAARRPRAALAPAPSDVEAAEAAAAPPASA